MTPQHDVDATPNPHALAAIVEAAAGHVIVADQDLVDERGTKLWARGQVVSQALQQRLLERKLAQPLESCLRARDGVTPAVLQRQAREMLDDGSALMQALRPQARLLLMQLEQLPLHAALQLLLTAALAARPALLRHAVRAMLLAGALQAARDPSPYEQRLAMLAGLAHDLGELYLDPQQLAATQVLDTSGFRTVVTHPRVGEMLLRRLTDYPPALAQAVAEHHERLDGSGYPVGRPAASLSPLGRLLAAAEVVLGVEAARPGQPLAQAALALRVVPGEHEPSSAAFLLRDAAAQATETPAAAAGVAGLAERRERLAAVLAHAEHEASHVAALSGAPLVAREIAATAAARLQRLQVAWRAAGLWAAPAALEGQAEVDGLLAEFEYRLRTLERRCAWPLDPAQLAGAEALRPLWEALRLALPEPMPADAP